MIDVMNLRTGQVYTYDTDDPKKAIQVCHQQMVARNYVTWANVPDVPIQESTLCYYTGDLATFKDGSRIE